MTTTWSAPGTRSALATCSTGTEAAPSASNEGIALAGLATLEVFVETDGEDEGEPVPFSPGNLRAFLLNPHGGDGAGQWNRAPDLDLVVPALVGAGYRCVNVAASGGRLSYLPDGLGQPCRVYHNGYT